MFKETSGGWRKFEQNPLVGGGLGHCFDMCVIRDNDVYRMYFSWQTTKCIAVVESADGMEWTDNPVIVLSPRESGWETQVNRPAVIKKDGKYQMWYTGQAGMIWGDIDSGHSWIGYAESQDGIVWERLDKPVLGFEQDWEKGAVMCPDVIWDEEEKIYRMWYSAGGQWEPDNIGYATSPDGVNWEKYKANPVFIPDPSSKWDHYKVAGAQVTKHKGWYVMSYIGYSDVDNWTCRIGLARSKDGITNWERHRSNPVISIAENQDSWDARNCYKPYAIFEKDKDRWLLWYNGRNHRVYGKALGFEQVGLAIHEGEDLGF